MKAAIIGLAAGLIMPACLDAEIIEFEASSAAKFIRCTDVFGTASCEILIDGSVEMFSCVALDEAGEPIATGGLLDPMTSVTFPDLDAATVSDVICREG